jgi:membrane protein insertase Oxa1/YidC/SpoIIIJ
MPIRLNLLAEAQAAADMRRRDPVKRAIMLSVVLVAIMLGWSGYLYLKSMMANSELGKIELQMQAHTNKYQQIKIALDKTDEIKLKLHALSELTTNRFLNGNLMQALQQTTVDDVQIIRLRLEQAYAYSEGSKRKTNDDKIIPATPARSTEKTMLTLEGNDTSPRFDQYTKLQDALISHPYFKAMLVKTNGVTLRSGSLSMPQISLSGKPTVSFAFECRFPEKTR